MEWYSLDLTAFAPPALMPFLRCVFSGFRACPSNLEEDVSGSELPLLFQEGKLVCRNASLRLIGQTLKPGARGMSPLRGFEAFYTSFNASVG